ncbi:tail associated lysin [Bacillus phage JBP901]|uniref:Putative membrane protein n=1 Tax=Bacillus phage JBP901 TaxID=1498212 RepID=A0A0E3DEV6_9CAUD|nr:tail associated lysin [Bacillus phage JBP901]AID17893.1 putative membrane protein [Bacillus phage JBP901]
MAGNKQDYIIELDAKIDKAVSKLNKIRSMMDEIERIRDKGADNNYTASTQDINKNMRIMKLLTQQYNQATEELKKLQAQANKTPKGAKRDEQHKRIRDEQKAIRREYDATLAKFREIASYQQKYSKNFNATIGEINLPTKDFEKTKEVISGMVEESNRVKNKLDEVVTKIREVNKLDRRSESLSRRASASKYMSFQQYSNFKKDRNTVDGYHQEKADNLRRMTEMSTTVSSLMKQIKKIEEKPTATRAELDRKLEMQKNIESMDKEFESRIELNRVLDRTIANMEKYNNTVQGVTVKPERGTFKGMAYERAPAIGLAITGAMAAALGSLYHQGASIDKGMRQDEISIGQRIGMDGSQWREDIRNNALNSGLKDRLGLSGQEMIGFQENYLSKRGYSGMDDLNTAMQNQAVFSRTSGINTEDTKSFFNTVYGAGPVNGKQTKEIQNAFLGAIKRSGMEGREKDQLKALDGILSGMSEGRSMTNDEIMNTMGLQSVLAQTGNRALQGEKGGRMLQSLDQGIRNGIDDPMVRMVFGQGTKYQGLEGRWALTKKMEKGISDAGNVRDIASFAQSQGGTKESQNMNFYEFARTKLGAEISTQQAEALMEAFRKGDLTDENLKKVLKGDTSVGDKVSKDKLEEYKKSSAATNNQSDAVTEKQAAGIYDMGEAVRDVNASMDGLPPVVYGAIAALGALTVAFAAAATSFAISSGVRSLASSTFGGKGKGRRGGRGGGPTGGGGNSTIVGGGSGGRRDRGGSGNTVAWNRGSTPNGANAPKQSWWSKMFGGGAGATEGAVAAGSTAASSGKGFLKGAGKVAGKVALPLAILSSVADIFTAPEGKKGEAIGSSVGGIGGGIAAGAAVGSVFPGIGTIIGGIVGGIAGAWGGGKIGGMFDSDPDKEKKKAEAQIKKEKEKAENRATNPSSITGFGHQGGTIAGHTATSMTVGATVGAGVTSLASNLDPGLTNQVITPSTGNSVNSTNTQVDKENTNTKQRTEVKKTDNLSYERENLNIYERALMKAEQLLAQARAQNGIFGNGNGAGGTGGGSGMGVTGGGKLQLLSAGQKWQNASNLQQSDLGFTEATLTAADLDKWIDSKAPKDSMMRGMGETFLKAGQMYGLDPRYLVAHAAEESAWGTSNIAKQKGNFFGIGAFDNSPMESAYTFKDGGGTAAQNGIMGGAKWIAEKYYGKGRTTLDKMHQAGYATNADWASNIASIMKGAPSGSGQAVNATINVNVKGDESVAKKINNSSEMKKVGNNIADMLGFYSKEMVMT